MVTKIHEDVIKVVTPQSEGAHCTPSGTMTAIAAEHEQKEATLYSNQVSSLDDQAHYRLMDKPGCVVQDALILEEQSVASRRFPSYSKPIRAGGQQAASCLVEGLHGGQHSWTLNRILVSCLFGGF